MITRAKMIDFFGWVVIWGGQRFIHFFTCFDTLQVRLFVAMKTNACQPLSSVRVPRKYENQ